MAFEYETLRLRVLYPEPGFPPIPGYQALFSENGTTISTNDEEIPLVRVNPSDARAAEKSLMALTIVRASFRDNPPMDEKAAFQALARSGNAPDAPLPPGFYLIGPDGKIASSMFASIVGGGDDCDEAALEDVAAANPKSFSTPHWITLARFDLDKFLQNSTRFADSLEHGVGSEESLSVRGVQIQCRRSDGAGAMWPGYPAPWLVDSEVISSRAPEMAALSRVAAAAGRKENPGKGLRVDPFSALVPLAALRKVPIFNHNGSSDLANARDISSVSERVPQRQKMLEHLFEGWSEIHVLLSGAKDEEIGADPADPVADRIRSGEALLSRPFGDAHRILAKSAATSAVCAGGKTLILSADFSLVSARAATRDCWLIAAGLGLDAGIRFDPNAGPVHPSDPDSALDCAPERLKAAFAGMLSKLLKDDPEAPLLFGRPMDRKVAEALGGGGRVSGEAAAVFEALFENFKLSVGERWARVQFDPVFTDSEARQVIESIG